MREIIIVFIRRAIIISSYLLPYALCKKLFYLTRMRLFSRILSEKAINQINRGGGDIRNDFQISELYTI